MCKRDEYELVRVRIPRDLSCSGRAKWKRMRIDRCIAPLVGALQSAGINMRGSCCGHGEVPGAIDLEDGRTIFLVASGDKRGFEGYTPGGLFIEVAKELAARLDIKN